MIFERAAGRSTSTMRRSCRDASGFRESRVDVIALLLTIASDGGRAPCGTEGIGVSRTKRTASRPRRCDDPRSPRGLRGFVAASRLARAGMWVLLSEIFPNRVRAPRFLCGFVTRLRRRSAVSLQMKPGWRQHLSCYALFAALVVVPSELPETRGEAWRS